MEEKRTYIYNLALGQEHTFIILSTFLFSFIIEPEEICLSLGLWLAGYNTPLLGDVHVPESMNML